MCDTSVYIYTKYMNAVFATGAGVYAHLRRLVHTRTSVIKLVYTKQIAT